MYRRSLTISCLTTAWVAMSVTLVMDQAFAQQQVAQQKGATSDDQIEILTRGPVHEAFAETVVFDPEPGMIVPKLPPAAIEELPPEQKPGGENMSWIPGYWAWDDERDDFIWISGIWRALPPGRQWVPGYWTKSQRGVQWTSGFWANAKLEEIEYLPEPPASVESGPNVPAPTADHTWLPGNWVWHQNRYVWRPGYWAPGQADWNWVPPHYVWTPRGYVAVDGYYDYSVNRRGVLHAPVHFRSNVYTQSDFRYSPTTVINPAVFANHLFLRPNSGHYYFGDYYGENYSTQGYSPWFSYHSNYSGYDPFYAHQRWQNRSDQQWNQRLLSDFERRRSNEQARPPRNWTSQRDRFSQGGVTDDSLRVGATVDEFMQSRGIPFRFQPLAQDARQQFGSRGRELNSLHEQRFKFESEANVRDRGGPPDQSVSPTRFRLPTPPIVGRLLDQIDGGNAPPRIFDAPPSDPRIQPKPRVPRTNRLIPPLPGIGDQGIIKEEK